MILILGVLAAYCQIGFGREDGLEEDGGLHPLPIRDCDFVAYAMAYCRFNSENRYTPFLPDFVKYMTVIFVDIK